MKSVSGGTGASFLPQTEINPAHHFALLIQVLQRSLHFSIQEHRSINLDALFLVEIVRFADGWNRRIQVARNFVTNFIAFADLTNREAGLFQPMVDDGIGALRGSRYVELRVVTVQTMTAQSFRNILVFLGQSFDGGLRLGLLRILTRVAGINQTPARELGTSVRPKRHLLRHAISAIQMEASWARRPNDQAKNPRFPATASGSQTPSRNYAISNARLPAAKAAEPIPSPSRSQVLK